MSSSRKAKIVFALALLLLSLSGIAAGLAIARLYTAETQVRHTYDIEVAIGDLQSALTEVGRTRVAYVNSGTSESLKSFDDALAEVGAGMVKLRHLIQSPEQKELCDRLEATANQRIAVSRESVELKQQNQSDAEKQSMITLEVARGAFETAIITDQMRRNEDALLEQRSHLSQLLFTTIPGILSISFLLSAGLFWFYYRMLNRELRDRTLAENQLRQLSLQLMRVQDEEHRRFARELHDGLGQNLAGAKMMVDTLANGNLENSQISAVSALLDDALSQTRTISHLFHPPFLDEIGFASAARWLIEGYEQRMGVAVSANIPQSEHRLPPNLELTLYRVLQEALNNIHRHSKSDKAEVDVKMDGQWVTLRVKDYGTGIPGETLAALGANGKQAGVGLTGMKERVKEQGGKLEINSEATGTEIIVNIPLAPQ
jgi:signal transduction histidine kinase